MMMTSESRAPRSSEEPRVPPERRAPSPTHSSALEAATADHGRELLGCLWFLRRKIWAFSLPEASSSEASIGTWYCIPRDQGTERPQELQKSPPQQQDASASSPTGPRDGRAPGELPMMRLVHEVLCGSMEDAP